MRIVIVGDIALSGQPERMILHGRGNELTVGVRELLREDDLCIGNIETPLTDSDKPGWDYFRTLKASKGVGPFLKELGVDVGSLANNHIADYGRQGMADTISVLEEIGIVHVGAGWTEQEASRPLILERGGLRIGILSLAQPEISASTALGWGAGVLVENRALKTMSSLSSNVNIAIAYLHYGVEFSEYPTPHQVRLSRRLVEAGAKLVIGHHPHVSQGYERYNEGFIAYSLGNFIFEMSDGPHRFSRVGLVVQADFQESRLVDVNVVPVDTRGAVAKVLHPTEIGEAESYLRRLCEVVADSQKLNEAYYFTCRNNFELYAGAFLYNMFRKRNWRQARDSILQQLFWPQIFELRRDLMRFVFSGKALKFERSRNKLPKDLRGRIWWWFCRVGMYLGLPLSLFRGYRIG